MQPAAYKIGRAPSMANNDPIQIQISIQLSPQKIQVKSKQMYFSFHRQQSHLSDINDWYIAIFI